MQHPEHTPPPHGFRTFVIVWITQSVSAFGSNLTFFAITLWLTQSLFARPDQRAALAGALAALTLSFTLPGLLVTPFAGAWADRHDRKRTMATADLVSGLLSGTMAALMVTDRLRMDLLLILTVLFALAGAFHGASFDTAYATLVPKEKLPRANGMMQAMWSLSSLLAPGIAAMLVALPGLARQGHFPGVIGAPLARLSSGSALAVGVDAVTFLLSSVTLLFLHVPSPIRHDMQAAEGKQKPSIWADIREGLHYIWRRRPLLWLLGTFTVFNLLAAPLGVLEPLIVKFTLAADWSSRHFTFEQALALLGTVLSAGGLAGGLLVSTWGGLKKNRVYGVLIPLTASGVALTVFGLSRNLVLSAVTAALVASTGPIANAHSQAIWQTQVPHALQGRVFAVRRVIAQCTAPLGTVLAGLTAGIFSASAVIATAGVLMTVFCFAQLLNPAMLRVEDKAWLDSLADGTAAEPDEAPAVT